MRIVKKTLKGNLLGNTKLRSAATKRERDADPLAPSSKVELPTRLKPRTQATLDALVKDDDVVIIPNSLKPAAGKPIPIGKPERATRLEAKVDRPEPQGKGLSFGPGEETEVRTEAMRPAKRFLKGPGKAKPAAPTSTPAAPAAPAPPKPVAASEFGDDSVSLARAVLCNALLRAFGEPGSEVRSPTGTTFHVASGRGEGIVRTRHLVTIPLPSGHVVSHEADLVVELDNKAILMVDIVASHTPPEAIKARSFDALLLRRLPNSFSALVCVRTPGPGIQAEQLEAIAHGYDLHFNIESGNVHLEQKFAALRSRVEAWLGAAAKPKA